MREPLAALVLVAAVIIAAIFGFAATYYHSVNGDKEEKCMLGAFISFNAGILISCVIDMFHIWVTL